VAGESIPVDQGRRSGVLMPPVTATEEQESQRTREYVSKQAVQWPNSIPKPHNLEAFNAATSLFLQMIAKDETISSAADRHMALYACQQWVINFFMGHSLTEIAHFFKLQMPTNWKEAFAYAASQMTFRTKSTDVVADLRGYQEACALPSTNFQRTQTFLSNVLTTQGSIHRMSEDPFEPGISGAEAFNRHCFIEPFMTAMMKHPQLGTKMSRKFDEMAAQRAPSSLTAIFNVAVNLQKIKQLTAASAASAAATKPRAKHRDKNLYI
jgi:hypothetical protein